MIEIKKHFNDFTYRSRVLPACIILIPVILHLINKNFVNKNFLGYGIYYALIIVTLTFLSYIARNEGKKHEVKMITKLGALPSTILLMISDNRLDKYTKNRYHKKLSKNVSNVRIPMSLEEEKTRNSKEIYDSCINWLRNYANSDKKRYPFVYSELVKYNYWRNLYGLKLYGIIIYLVLGIREIIIISEFNILDMFVKPYPEYFSLIIMILSIFILMFVVTKQNIEERAFEYGKALLEICEHL